MNIQTILTVTFTVKTWEYHFFIYRLKLNGVTRFEVY